LSVYSRNCIGIMATPSPRNDDRHSDPQSSTVATLGVIIGTMVGVAGLTDWPWPVRLGFVGIGTATLWYLVTPEARATARKATSMAMLLAVVVLALHGDAEPIARLPPIVGTPSLVFNAWQDYSGYLELVIPLADAGLMSCRHKGNPDEAQWDFVEEFATTDGQFGDVTLIQSDFWGNLELVALQHSRLTAYHRDRGPSGEPPWNGPLPVAVSGRVVVGIGGQPALVQAPSNWANPPGRQLGGIGDFVLAAPLRRGGVAVYRRDNRAGHPFPWSGPELLVDEQGRRLTEVFDAASMTVTAAGELELVVRAQTGGRMFLTRTMGGHWQPLVPLRVNGRQISGTSGENFAVVQGVNGLEMVLPDERGGLRLYWRDDEQQPTQPWHGPYRIGLHAGVVDAVAMSYDTVSGRLEVVARQGRLLRRFWREADSAPGVWHGPADVACKKGR
jgi:hypothetical protein